MDASIKEAGLFRRFVAFLVDFLLLLVPFLLLSQFLIGPAMARLARPVRLQEKVLYLEVPHSALIRELAPSLDLFLRRIAACIGKGACESIKLIPSGSLSRSRRGK